jgi:inorganic phosphate transporter, PiT family
MGRPWPGNRRAMSSTVVLALVVITALSFDFTNGFHDTGNAMATSIATRALPPKAAVMLSAVLNLAGAFLSFNVAATVASGLVDAHLVSLTVVFGGVTGGIIWNLLTWYLGIPSSSSHALMGGVVGAALAAVGPHGVQWANILAKVIIPAALSPIIAALVAAVGTALVYRLSRGVPDRARSHGFRLGQIGSASMVSLAHGTNDAQKTMGVITLALVTTGGLPAGAKAPEWVILVCALAIALGTYAGGWRVIRTLGKGLVELDSPQGMAAEGASAATILLSSHFGYSLSTTHVATGSIIGTGLGRRGSEVRWGIAGRMAIAWLLTLPAAAVTGAAAYAAAQLIPDSLGVLVVFAVLIALAGGLYLRSRRTPVHAGNVNAEWRGSGTVARRPVPVAG